MHCQPLLVAGPRAEPGRDTGRRSVPASVSCLLAATLACAAALAPESARASGNYTHVRVATHALDFLDAGALKDLLSRPELLQMLRNGAMFPDGGYAVDDGYGEIAHWEPFQRVYLEWIRSHYQPPWSDEAAQHIAFLMGMAAHGLTDQLFDGMFLERAGYHDGNARSPVFGGIDGLTDACFALAMGDMDAPQPWVPAKTLAPLFGEASGHTVTAATIDKGQTLVPVAILYAQDRAHNAATMKEAMDTHPWACGRVDDASVPGSPPAIPPVVGRYWAVLWARLNGADTFDQPLLGTFFADTLPCEVPLDAASPDSWVSFAMPRGLDPATVGPQSVRVEDASGAAIPVQAHVYYGKHSHLVNLKPAADWSPGTLYSVTLAVPMSSWEGIALAAERRFTFGTPPAPGAPYEDSDGTLSCVIPGGLAETVAGDDLSSAEPGPGRSGSSSQGSCAVAGPQSVPGASRLPLLLLALLALLAAPLATRFFPLRARSDIAVVLPRN